MDGVVDGIIDETSRAARVQLFQAVVFLDRFTTVGRPKIIKTID
jgi:hypothetical protein